MLRMHEVPLGGKRVVIREDLNVPMKDGAITDDTRLRAAAPTIKQALTAGAAVILLSHLGRPKEGHFDQALSLAPVATALSELVGVEVRLARDWLDGVEVGPGQCVLCENVRFAVGEKANDDALARRMAALGEVFVHDAFATAHRAQASTHGIAKHAPVACAGPLLCAELDALARALEQPARPLVAIVGGAKVSTKLQVLETLLAKVDQLIVGGGIANTFLKAAGCAIGRSLCEEDMVGTAARLIDAARSPNAAIAIPSDVVCGREFSATAAARVTDADGVAPDEMIMDIGPATCARLSGIIRAAGTIVWNGPLGVFEFDAFAAGTRAVADAVASAAAFSIAGGGDTLAAIAKFSVGDRISYISTGGGAFLEFLEGKTLPAVEVLESRA